MRRQALLGFALTTATCLAFSPLSGVRAEPGVDVDKIIFGQAAVLEGPASALGQEMRAGILAAFAEGNRTGGVKGRQLELISLDDGYEPNKSIEMTRRLIEVDKVFALVGPVGTPTSAATQPIAAVSYTHLTLPTILRV